MGKRKWIKPEIRGYSGGVVFWHCIMPASLAAEMIRMLAKPAIDQQERSE